MLTAHIHSENPTPSENVPAAHAVQLPGKQGTKVTTMRAIGGGTWRQRQFKK